jgi:CHAD domain-containing protein
MTSLTTPAPVEQRSGASAQPAVCFSLRYGEPADVGTRRIMVEQVQLGSWHMERAAHGDRHVHEVRKATKRVRAVLRMVRDDIDQRDYFRLNLEVRDLARDLSQIRSAVVQVELLESVIANDDSLAADTGDIHRDLASMADELRSGLRGRFLEDLLLRMEDVRSGVEGIRFLEGEKASFGGIRKTYRRGRGSMSRAYVSPSVQSFHAWRKQVKYLRHQMEVLEEEGPPAMSGLVTGLEVICERLGMDHDLADLQRAVTSVPSTVLSPSSRDALSDVINTQRVGLQHSLRPDAERVYAAKPGDFTDQVLQHLE